MPVTKKKERKNRPQMPIGKERKTKPQMLMANEKWLPWLGKKTADTKRNKQNS